MSLIIKNKNLCNYNLQSISTNIMESLKKLIILNTNLILIQLINLFVRVLHQLVILYLTFSLQFDVNLRHHIFS